MGLVARRDLEDAGLDLDKTLFVEKAPHRPGDRGSRQQERLSIGVPCRRPPWRRLIAPGHQQPGRAVGNGAAVNSFKGSADDIDIIRLSP
jgi:hypothetical protein